MNRVNVRFPSHWCRANIGGAVKLYPCAVEEPDAWGNLLAFKSDPGIWSIGKFLGFGITTLDALQSRVRTLEQELEGLRRSTSWRITAPLRVARTETRRALRRIRGASR